MEYSLVQEQMFGSWQEALFVVRDAAVNPKERVRFNYYFNLIEVYHYSVKCVEFDVELPASGSLALADIVVYRDDEKVLPLIVVECLAENASTSKINQALSQAIAKAHLIKAAYAVCLAGSVKRIVDLHKWKGNIQQATIPDIPVAQD